MAEETEGQERGAAPVGAAVDPAAAALALGSADREKANRYLDEQTLLAQKQQHLVDLQAHELQHELSLRHWSLRVHHISDVLKLAFELAAALVVTAVAGFIGVAMWNAAHDRGLVVESFQVPPDLAARGLSGEVVAGQILDRLQAMQNATRSGRPAQSYANNWGNDLKVQIPDTGVSIGEFYRYLRQWLGHETHISGEVFRDAKGITLVARVSDSDSARVSGSENDLDPLLQKVAEAIYARTQPYRYAIYELQGGANWREAKRIHTTDTLSADPLERAFAWVGLGFIAMLDERDMHAANADFWRSTREIPEFSFGWGDIESYSEPALGHDEAALAATRKSILYEGRYMRPETARELKAGDQVELAEYLGDFASAFRINLDAATLYGRRFSDSAQVDLAFLHDRDARAQRRWQPGIRFDAYSQPFAVAAGLRDWRAVLALEPQTEALLRKERPGFDLDVVFSRYYRPWMALANAKLGDGAGALKLIGSAPLDCYTCVRFRGDIDAALKRPDAAAFWFDMAVREAPSIPFAYADWGAMLLAKGDVDAAIAKLREANLKGPHFADPLEMWGEALMQKNRSNLALAKFEEANKYAPNWGRLHLKWGEALVYAGKRDEAKTQFALASALDLSAPDKSELLKNMRRT